MAPEQALGRQVDRRADIWAVGALLYHLLSGQPPYEGPNPLATLHLLTSGKPPPPLPASVPKPIVEVVERALSHAPDDRPPSAAALQEGLERAMVAANVATTTADVERFVGLHLCERAARRKQAIDLALRAASERIRIKPLLAIPRADSIVDSSQPASRVSLDALALAQLASEPPREAPSTAPTQSERPPQPEPQRAARSRRALVASLGIVTCVIGMTAVLSLAADSRSMARRDPTAPLAASIQSPIASNTSDERTMELPPTTLPSSGVAELPDSPHASSTATVTTNTQLPIWPPAPPTTPIRAEPSPKPSASASKIPEVIDNGF
jgi:serine/threonine-protein kinase